MHAIAENARGLSLLVQINWVRILPPIMVMVALWAGTVLGKMLLN